MKITHVSLSLNSSGNVVAYANFVIDNDFEVRGVRVIKRTDGGFLVAMPSRPDARGVYKDTCFPRNADSRNHIEQMIFGQLEAMGISCK